MAQNDPVESELKGFAGLMGLLSDINVEPAKASRPTKPTASNFRKRATKPINRRAQQPPGASTIIGAQTRANNSAAQSTAGRSLLGMTFIGLAFCGFIYAIVQSHSAPTSVTADASGAPAADATANSIAADASTITAASPPPPSEVAPTVGSTTTLSAEEIRYCSAETSRLEAVRPLVNDKDNLSIYEFTEKLKNLNTRCAGRTYTVSTFNEVNAELKQRLDQIEQHARSDWLSAHPLPSGDVWAIQPGWKPPAVAEATPAADPKASEGSSGAPADVPSQTYSFPPALPNAPIAAPAMQSRPDISAKQFTSEPPFSYAGNLSN